MEPSIARDIAGEKIWFFTNKGAFWEKAGMLIVADLHWGKAGVFQAAGIPVPDDTLAMDLHRLSVLMKDCDAREIVVLGDLIHAPQGLGRSCCSMIRKWRLDHPIPLGLVLGNHDRSFRHIPRNWNITPLGTEYYQGPFCFRHEPEPSPHHHVWAGHVHPMVKISFGHDRLRLPCFWLRPAMTLLPSFSVFTRGVNIRPDRDDQLILVHDHGLFPWHPSR